MNLWGREEWASLHNTSENISKSGLSLVNTVVLMAMVLTESQNPLLTELEPSERNPWVLVKKTYLLRDEIGSTHSQWEVAPLPLHPP